MSGVPASTAASLGAHRALTVVLALAVACTEVQRTHPKVQLGAVLCVPGSLTPPARVCLQGTLAKDITLEQLAQW